MKTLKIDLEVLAKFIIVILSLMYLIEDLNFIRYTLMFISVLILGIIAFKNKNKYMNLYMLLASLFILSFLVTILSSDKSVHNVIEFVDFILIFFGLFHVTDSENNEKLMLIFSYIYLVFTFLMAIVDLVMYVIHYEGSYYFIDHYEYLGIRENRLWGIFNANMTAFLSCLSIIISIIFLMKINKHKKKIILNIVLQMHVFIYAQSRTMWIVSSIVITVYVLKYFTAKYILKRLLIAFLIVGGIYISSNIYSSITINVPKAINMMFSNENLKDEEIEASRIVDSENVSQGRVDLWKKTISMAEERPLFGIGLRPLKEDAYKNFTHKWASIIRLAGVHNIYIMIFAVSGAIGLILFLMFAGVCMFRFVKYILKKDAQKYMVVVCTFCAAMFVEELFESRMLYIMNYYTVTVFLMMGYALDKINKTFHVDKN